jgi:autotransporter-associated beta strand protein
MVGARTLVVDAGTNTVTLSGINTGFTGAVTLMSGALDVTNLNALGPAW